jgi:hypothetical protein
VGNLFLIAVLLGTALCSSTAFARRQFVTCDEGKNTKAQYTARASFDPDIALDTVWRRLEKGSRYIETYLPGEEDGNARTTAQVQFTVPGDKQFSKEFTGAFALSEFYNVNVFGTLGNEDAVGPHRKFHGFDKNQRFDAILFLSNAGLRAGPEKFKGLLNIQPSNVSQGYYHINLVCSSRVRN